MHQWGRHYVMVDPEHYRIAYEINPFMDTAVQPDPARARAQWQTLRETLEGLGARVDVVEGRPDAPDMVYAMNLGLGLVRPDRSRHVVMSHMRYPERRVETPTAASWFAEQGASTSYVGKGGVGPHLEAGDAFPFRGDLVVGYGPRTEELALKHLATDLRTRVRGLRITHPGMYHLDLAFCPLDDEHAIVCPDAFDAASAQAVLDLVPRPLILTEQEALTGFVANSVVVGTDIVMPDCPPRVRDWLEERGFTVHVVDVSEFHLGGGSVRCMTNPVDLTFGRDLEVRDHGDVLLP